MKYVFNCYHVHYYHVDLKVYARPISPLHKIFWKISRPFCRGIMYQYAGYVPMKIQPIRGIPLFIGMGGYPLMVEKQS